MRALPQGIYTPLPCFFTDDEDLDLAAFQKHVQFVSSSNTVPVVSGTMGEAVHLSRDERKQLIRAGRDALDQAGLADVPIVAGIGASSTRESIQFCQDAAESGAEFVMAIPPGYYAGALLAEIQSVRDFFVDIAEASPLPVILYNFPAVSGGIDMDSDLVMDIVKAAPNVCGIKLTCADVGKLTRITAEVNSLQFTKLYPRRGGVSFSVIDGFIDFLLPSVMVGSAGAISGLPNIAPKACVKLWRACQRLDTEEGRREAQELQNIISLADGVALKIGISGMKRLLNKKFGYGPLPRRPLLPMGVEKGDQVLANPYVKRLLDLEACLTKE